MQTLDFALLLKMIGSPAQLIRAVLLEVFGEIPRDVTWAVIAKQPRLVQHGGRSGPRTILDIQA